MSKFTVDTEFGHQQFDLALQDVCGSSVVMIKRVKVGLTDTPEWFICFMENSGAPGFSWRTILLRLRWAWYGLIGKADFSDVILRDGDIRELIGYAKEQWEEGGH